MRIIPAGRKYESKIYVIDKEKLIFKIYCLCKDFQHRRIKRIGEFNDIKYYGTPCKHLKPGVEALEKLGYKLKKHEAMEGSNKLTAEVRREVVNRSGGICEVEECPIVATRFHRIIRGQNGGKYIPENIKHICENHHKQIHASEFPGSKSK